MIMNIKDAEILNTSRGNCRLLLQTTFYHYRFTKVQQCNIFGKRMCTFKAIKNSPFDLILVDGLKLFILTIHRYKTKLLVISFSHNHIFLCY